MTTRTHPANEAQPLPHSLEAERAVLGAILLDNVAMEVASDRLRPADFFLAQHTRIFSAMLAIRERSEPIDTVTLSEELTRTKELDNAGGIAYLAQIPDGLPRLTNVEHHAKIIRTKAMLRSLAHSADGISQEALAAADEPAAILERAEAAIAKLRASAGSSGEPTKWREMFDSHQELEETPELRFSIRGFLQNDGATMIGGLSGHGKTLILCSITKALLAGKGAKLWDLFPVEENAVRVVYLIPECSRAPFKHRLKLFRIYDAVSPSDDRLLVRTLSKGPAPVLSDPRILFAAKGAHVILDTATRFVEGDQNSAGDNAHGLAADIFALLGSGARTVICAHHSPKPFRRESTMNLENVLRGSGDIGAMLTTGWGVKQIDEDSNTLHIQNVKPRDFQPCGPFQIIGRPYIDAEGDFRLLKRPGECGALAEEVRDTNPSGARPEDRQERRARVEMTRNFLQENPSLTAAELCVRFKNAGKTVSESAVKKYRKEVFSSETDF